MVRLLNCLTSRQKPDCCSGCWCQWRNICSRQHNQIVDHTAMSKFDIPDTKPANQSHLCQSIERTHGKLTVPGPPYSVGAVTFACRGQCTCKGAEGCHPSCQLANRFPPLQCKGARPSKGQASRRQAPRQVSLLHGEGLGWLHRPQHQHQAWGLGMCCLQTAQLCQEPGMLQVWGAKIVSDSLLSILATETYGWIRLDCQAYSLAHQ